jgi:hypothetical protein
MDVTSASFLNGTVLTFILSVIVAAFALGVEIAL